MPELGPDEVRRPEDGELLGSVTALDDGRWVARTVFGGVLGVRDSPVAARAVVESDGLASLARRWFHRPPDGAWTVVLIQEAWPGRVRLIEGLYSLPGIPTIELTAADLEAGHVLTLEPPDDADLDGLTPVT